MIDQSIALECDCLPLVVATIVALAPSKAVGSIYQMMLDLHVAQLEQARL